MNTAEQRFNEADELHKQAFHVSTQESFFLEIAIKAGLVPHTIDPDTAQTVIEESTATREALHVLLAVCGNPERLDNNPELKQKFNAKVEKIKHIQRKDVFKKLWAILDSVQANVEEQPKFDVRKELELSKRRHGYYAKVKN